MTATAAPVDLRHEYLSLLEEKATRLAERSLRSFIEQAWPVLEPTKAFQPNWHIDAIAEHLEAVTAGEIQNLLINVPPGCMKSYIVSVLWPAWEWITRPDLRYLCISFDQGLSTRDNLRVRDLLRSEWYQARWGHTVAIKADQNQKTRFDSTAGGWRIASTVRGRGLGEHPHRKIVDDPHNTRQALSDVERQVAIEFFDQTLSTRGAALQAATVVIMQRLHHRDLAGHILAGASAHDWTHLCFPMRAEPNRMKTTPIGFNDPRTKPGELLWPSMFPEAVVASTESKLGSYAAAGQFQQRPAPLEGGFLKRSWWKFYRTPPMPRLAQIVISLDPAVKDKQTSDHWACQAWGGHGADAFFLRSARGRWDLVEATQQMRDMYGWAKTTYPGVRITVLVENTAAGPDVIAALKREIPGIVAVNPKGDKVQRAFAVTPAIEAGNVWLVGRMQPDGLNVDTAVTPAWVQEFVNECAEFPLSAEDDQVDAMSQALLRLQASTMSAAVIKSGQKGAPPPSSPARMLEQLRGPHTASELADLEALVLQHGSEAVTRIRRLADKSFRLPAHLQGLPPGGSN